MLAPFHGSLGVGHELAFFKTASVGRRRLAHGDGVDRTEEPFHKFSDSVGEDCY